VTRAEIRRRTAAPRRATASQPATPGRAQTRRRHSAQIDSLPRAIRMGQSSRKFFSDREESQQGPAQKSRTSSTPEYRAVTSSSAASKIVKLSFGRTAVMPPLLVRLGCHGTTCLKGFRRGRPTSRALGAVPIGTRAADIQPQRLKSSQSDGSEFCLRREAQRRAEPSQTRTCDAGHEAATR
jgi:hypothetical protein